MSKTTSITIRLTPPQASALAAVAAGSGGDAAKLATWVLAEWIGNLPAERTTPRNLAVAERRLSILQSWWDARKRRGTTEAQARAEAMNKAFRLGVHVSRSQLYKWEADWRAGGLAGLLNQHRTRSSKAVQSPFVNRVKELYRAVRGRSLRSCYHEAAHGLSADAGKPPSYRTIHRIIKGKSQAA